MKNIISIGFLVGLSALAFCAHAEISIITTDTNLAAIAREVGGNKVKVESLSKGTDDLHHIEPTPSMVTKLAHAQLFARVGMDLDGWADSVLEKAGNTAVMKGGKGYVDCHDRLVVQEIPVAKLDPSMGDIHVYGNPHYLMDPANGILAAGNIAAGLIKVDPANQPYYHQRFVAFGEAVKVKLKEWREMLAPYKGSLITTYHRSWVYFMSRYGFKEYGTVEPKPGIQPSQGHVNELIREMKADKVRVILAENFRSKRFPDLIAQQAGAKSVYVPTAVEGEPGTETYLKLFDVIVSRVAGAFK